MYNSLWKTIYTCGAPILYNYCIVMCFCTRINRDILSYKGDALYTH